MRKLFVVLVVTFLVAVLFPGSSALVGAQSNDCQMVGWTGLAFVPESELVWQGDIENVAGTSARDLADVETFGVVARRSTFRLRGCLGAWRPGSASSDRSSRHGCDHHPGRKWNVCRVVADRRSRARDEQRRHRDLRRRSERGGHHARFARSQRGVVVRRHLGGLVERGRHPHRPCRRHERRAACIFAGERHPVATAHPSAPDLGTELSRSPTPTRSRSHRSLSIRSTSPPASRGRRPAIASRGPRRPTGRRHLASG